MSITTLTVSEGVARLLLEGTASLARDVAEALDRTTDLHGCRDRLIVLCRLADALEAGERELDVGEYAGLLASICERPMLATLEQGVADVRGERRAAYERDLAALSAFHGALRQTVARLTVTVPARVFALLRDALLVELAVACRRAAEAPGEWGVASVSRRKRFVLGPHALSLELTVTRRTGEAGASPARSDRAAPLQHIDRLRAALDRLGCEQAPDRDTQLLITGVMAETLERELERVAAGADAELIRRFLNGLEG